MIETCEKQAAERIQRMRASRTLLMAALLLSACGTRHAAGNAATGVVDGGNAATPVAAASEDGSHLPKDFARLPMKEFMGHVMQNGGGRHLALAGLHQ